VGYRSPAEKALEIELSAARDDADRLRAKLAEAEARAAAAEQRLEQVGGSTRERERSLEDALERLRLADSELARARRTAARFEEEARAAVAAAQNAEDSGRALAARDDRIAALEIEKQDLVWRMAELEDKLRDAIARAVRTAASPGPTQPIPPPQGPPALELEAGPPRGLGEFHRAAAAHVQELTELKAAVGEQSALVAELEDALAAAEVRAVTAEAEATAARKTAKDMEEADRSRRSRLAELEGKLLRLEHERKAAIAAGPIEPVADVETARVIQELRREIEALRAARDESARRLEEAQAAWSREQERLQRELEARAAEKPAQNGHGEHTFEAREVITGGFGNLSRAPDQGALLENTIGNYRQRAGRLRDDVEGVRRRIESLSPHEIAGFLEELGEDLAELEK
jgi:chromosome segregation ATPase